MNIKKIIRSIKRYFHNRNYTYGFTLLDSGTNMRSRLNLKNNNLEFVCLINRNVNKNIWLRMDSSWKKSFTPS